MQLIEFFPLLRSKNYSSIEYNSVGMFVFGLADLVFPWKKEEGLAWN
jgi:hypothetical protein